MMQRTSDASRVGTEHNPWNDTTIAQMFDRVVADRPDAVALVDGSLSVTFAQMQRSRDQAGSALAALGVGDGTHVAVLMNKGLEYSVILHSLWLIGAVAVPLNAMWTRDEVRRALNDTDTEVLVIGTKVGGADSTVLLTELDLATQDTIEQPDLPRMRRVIRCAPDQGLDFPHQWLAQGIPQDAPPPRSTRQESLFLFTSGSASSPKAVVLRQDGLLGTAHYFFESLGVQDSDRFLSLGPYFHAGGIVQMLGCNQNGIAQYVFPRVDIPTVADVALRARCTALTGFDPVLSKIFAHIEAQGEKLPFRTVGASPGTEVYDALRGQGITTITMYAMSEGGNMITLASADDPSFALGRPLPGVSVRICDLEGRPVAAGEDGEICFKGWNLFRGYYNRESTSPTDVVTDEEHYFHTGDIGRMGADGRLHYLGRYSSTIKTAGENVSATEVEMFLVHQIPEVAAAAVIGIPDAAWGEAVVAFVELRPGSRSFDESWLRASCRGNLAGYKIPKRFIEVRAGEWPTAETGKLIRTALVATFLDDSSV